MFKLVNGLNEADLDRVFHRYSFHTDPLSKTFIRFFKSIKFTSEEFGIAEDINVFEILKKCGCLRQDNEDHIWVLENYVDMIHKIVEYNVANRGVSDAEYNIGLKNLLVFYIVEDKSSAFNIEIGQSFANDFQDVSTIWTAISKHLPLDEIKPQVQTIGSQPPQLTEAEIKKFENDTDTIAAIICGALFINNKTKSSKELFDYLRSKNFIYLKIVEEKFVKLTNSLDLAINQYIVENNLQKFTQDEAGFKIISLLFLANQRLFRGNSYIKKSIENELNNIEADTTNQNNERGDFFREKIAFGRQILQKPIDPKL